MSFNKYKATVRRLTELPWEDFRNLFTWPSGGSTLQAENPNLLIAKATKNGEVVAYVAAEPILLIDGYTFNPASDPSDTSLAGDAIDAALAQRAGVNRIWIVVPSNCPPIKGEHILRVVERKVFQPVNTVPKFDDCDLQQPTRCLN